MELVQSESIIPSIPAWLQGILRGYFYPHDSSSAFLHPSHTGRKCYVAMSPTLALATWSMAGHPILFLLHATQAGGLLFTRSKNSLGKFSEHKLSARSSKAALESCPYRGEKDKRRKPGKGAKEGSHERSGLPCYPGHCPQKPSLALDHCKLLQIHSLVATREI